MNTLTDTKICQNWLVPDFEVLHWSGKQHKYCVVIPVINEGKRIINLINRIDELQINKISDIIIIDGGSTDNSLVIKNLESLGVKGLLLKTSEGKLSAQLRCAYAFTIDQGYEGIITIDGNDKDDPEAIPRFIECLNKGVDFVQASRFIEKGISENIPLLRKLAIKYIHAPILSFSSGFKWTDSTQGFRGYSKRILLDPKVAPFRKIFNTYELLAYMSYRIPRLGYRCCEIATIRKYPKGKIPTKINSLKDYFNLFVVLLKSCVGSYNP
jgi:dolichol-phosphate mannosyltransferase